MSKRLNIAGLLSVAALALTLASSPAAAQCAIGSEPLSDPFAPYEEPGAIVHKDSGFVFPATVAGFQPIFPAIISKSAICGISKIMKLKLRSRLFISSN